MRHGRNKGGRGTHGHQNKRDHKHKGDDGQLEEENAHEGALVDEDADNGAAKGDGPKLAARLVLLDVDIEELVAKDEVGHDEKGEADGQNHGGNRGKRETDDKDQEHGRVVRAVLERLWPDGLAALALGRCLAQEDLGLCPRVDAEQRDGEHAQRLEHDIIDKKGGDLWHRLAQEAQDGRRGLDNLVERMEKRAGHDRHHEHIDNVEDIERPQYLHLQPRARLGAGVHVGPLAWWVSCEEKEKKKGQHEGRRTKHNLWQKGHHNGQRQ